MQANAVPHIPEELLELRKQIDLIDEEILLALARRFEVTDQVGRVKAMKELAPVDPKREQEKLQRLKRVAEEHDLNGDFVLELFQLLFNEVVKNHRAFQK